jgi:hypothetical protein
MSTVCKTAQGRKRTCPPLCTFLIAVELVVLAGRQFGEGAIQPGQRFNAPLSLAVANME